MSNPRQMQFKPETMKAIANEVWFMSDGTRVARVNYDSDTIAEDEARAYAQQFAQSTYFRQASETLKRLYPECPPLPPAFEFALFSLFEALENCTPKPKGKPFAPTKDYRPYGARS